MQPGGFETPIFDIEKCGHLRKNGLCPYKWLRTSDIRKTKGINSFSNH